MNEPHVVALHYRIEHADWIDYSKADPLEFCGQSFRVRVEGKRVRFDMNDHFATEQEACETVEDFIRNWELDVALSRGPGAFKLRFDNSDIIDQSPTPGVVRLRAPPVRVAISISQPQLTVSPREYPMPPSTGLTRSPDVESMFSRYTGYRGGKEPLAAMAYFCLDVLLATTGKRKGRLERAAKRYRVSQPVLKRLADLTSTKGGADARKAEGVHRDLTAEEKQFVEAAVTAMIRRVAEVAHDPNAEFADISMSEFAPRE
ncbi:MAG: hypothetical protein OXK82_05705 [Deltaproteobacteria bacterium]|nr:hypothetical protein [Deltaproteobacteria bacterium]